MSLLHALFLYLVCGGIMGCLTVVVLLCRLLVLSCRGERRALVGYRGVVPPRRDEAWPLWTVRR